MSHLPVNISRLAVILCLVGLLLAGGCIRENIDDCPVSVELTFLYYGNGITDIFPDKVDSVSMWAYRADGSFYTGSMIPARALDTLQGVRVALPPGDWKLVFWGNDGEGSHVDPAQLEQMLSTPEHRSGALPETIERLFHGTVDLSLPLTLRLQRDTVEYTSAHTAMTVEFIGFDGLGDPEIVPASAAADTGEIFFRHSDMHASIGWDNTPSDTRTTYRPSLERVDSTGSLITTYLVPRFADSDCGSLDIYRIDTGEKMWSRSLASILSELEIVTEDEEEAHVRLKIIRTPGGAGASSIKVVPWHAQDVYPVIP